MAAEAIIGTTEAGDPLALDIDRLIGTHACVVANSGGGKSGLIRRLLEETHGQVQHIILDIEDEFYTLRERFDYVIAGGEEGDAPATPDNAGALAIAALANDFSMIVQLNDLGQDAPDFVGRFLEALIGAPRDLWRPVLVVLDEAHRFAPSDGKTDATDGVKAMSGQGRKRGFTGIFASQRIAKIDPHVRGDVNNWLLGRVGQSLDRRTMADALGFAPSSAEARGLQGLPDRTFWGFGPAISREPILFRVRDVRTTPVRPGQAKVPTPPPPEALRAILAEIAAPPPPDDTIPADAAAAYAKGSEVGAMLVERDRRIAELEAEVAELRAEVDHLRGVDAECDRYSLGIGAAIDLLEALRDGADICTDVPTSRPALAKAADRESSAGETQSRPGEDRGGVSAAVPGEASGRAASPASDTAEVGDREYRALAGLVLDEIGGKLMEMTPRAARRKRLKGPLRG